MLAFNLIYGGPEAVEKTERSAQVCNLADAARLAYMVPHVIEHQIIVLLGTQVLQALKANPHLLDMVMRSNSMSSSGGEEEKVPQTRSQGCGSAGAMLNHKSSTSSLDEAVAKLRLGTLPAKGMSIDAYADTQVDMDVDEPQAQASLQAESKGELQGPVQATGTVPAISEQSNGKNQDPIAASTVPPVSVQSNGENQAPLTVEAASIAVPAFSMQSNGENQAPAAASTVPDVSMSKGENEAPASTVPAVSVSNGENQAPASMAVPPVSVSNGENQAPAAAASTAVPPVSVSKGENQAPVAAAMPDGSMQSKGENQAPVAAALPDVSMETAVEAASTAVPDGSGSMQSNGDNQAPAAASTVPHVSVQSNGENQAPVQTANTAVPDVSMQSNGDNQAPAAPSTDAKQLQVHEVLRRPNTCDLSAGVVPGQGKLAGPQELIVSIFMNVGGTKTPVQIRGMTPEQAVANGFELVGDLGTSSKSDGEAGSTPMPEQETKSQHEYMRNCIFNAYMHTTVKSRRRRPWPKERAMR